LLKDKHISAHTFWVLKKMMPFRQIEAAELMVAMNKYTCSYARSLLAATRKDQLVEPDKPKSIKVNGKSITEAKDIERSGWTWNPLEKGGVLKLKHSGGEDIEISL